MAKTQNNTKSTIIFGSIYELAVSLDRQSVKRIQTT